MNEKPSSEMSEHELLLRRVGKSFHELVASVVTARDLAARSQGLHPTDFACIGYLYRVGVPVSPKQIISQLQLTSGSGTALLDRLEAGGYTRRLPNPEDRRSLLVQLDEKKAAGALQRYREIEQSYRSVTRTFTEAELAIVARFMEAMGAFVRDLTEEPKGV